MSVAPDLPDYFTLIQALKEDAARVGNDFSTINHFLNQPGGNTTNWLVVVPVGEVWLITQAWAANEELTATPYQAAYGELRNLTTGVIMWNYAYVAGDGKHIVFPKPFLGRAGDQIRVAQTNAGGAAADFVAGFAGYRV